MKLDEFRLCVRPGSGLVARFPSSVLVVTAVDWAGMPAVDRLLEACRRASNGSPLAARLAEVIDEAGAQKVPAFCALAEDGDGLAMFVHGDSQVVITGAQPVMRLTGHGSAGWTSGINDGVASLAITPAGASTDAAPSDVLVDLHDGVVPGAGVLLLARDHPSPAVTVDQASDPADNRWIPPAADADQPGDPFVAPPSAAAYEPALPETMAAAPAVAPPPMSPPPMSPPPVTPATPPTVAAPPPLAMPPSMPTSVARPFPAPPPSPMPPPPPAASVPPPPPAASVPPPHLLAQSLDAADQSPTEAAPVAAVDGAPAMVWGIHCKRGHFNNPDARYCRSCGTHMVHQRKDPVLGPRPVLGFLVVDDGSTYKLDADYVIGHAPEADNTVRAGDARGLILSDPENTVSDVHAAIRLDKWEVFVTDLRSRFGTHVWKPGTEGWVRLDPGQTVMLEPRTHLLFGRRTIVFDSVNRR